MTVDGQFMLLDGRGSYTFVPRYRAIGRPTGTWYRQVMAPMNTVDRSLRSEYWEEHAHIYYDASPGELPRVRLRPE